MDKKLERVMRLDKEYYCNTFGERMPVCFTHGKGSYLYDTEDKKYLDLLGGIAVNSLGHANPRLVKAIADQAKKFIHCSSLYYIEEQAELAQALVKRTFADRVFLCNSGAEANEAALKLARTYFYRQGTPRRKIITAKQSFHGRTIATATATGQEKYNRMFHPLPDGFVHVPFNDIDAMAKLIDKDTCAVMLEPIQGESGVIPATREYLTAVRSFCSRFDVPLILDEVQTGVGRTGTLYAYEQFGIVPDILTSAKGLGGGVPIGAMLATEKYASAFLPGDHGSTFGGNPLAAAAALAVLKEIDHKNLLQNVQIVALLLRKKLTRISKNKSAIKEIRGLGLLVGIEFHQPVAVEIKNKALAAGFLVGSIGDRVLRLAPPLNVKKQEIQSFSNFLAEIL